MLCMSNRHEFKWRCCALMIQTGACTSVLAPLKEAADSAARTPYGLWLWGLSAVKVILYAVCQGAEQACNLGRLHL